MQCGYITGWLHIDGLVQERRNPSALAMEVVHRSIEQTIEKQSRWYGLGPACRSCEIIVMINAYTLQIPETIYMHVLRGVCNIGY